MMDYDSQPNNILGALTLEKAVLMLGIRVVKLSITRIMPNCMVIVT